MIKNSKSVDYFWSHVQKPRIKGKCWIYIGKQGNAIRRSRRSWIIHNGQIPKGMFVLHTCDNVPCVNPEHLFLGTAKDNMDDKHRKKRGRYTNWTLEQRKELSKAHIARWVGYSDEKMEQIRKTYSKAAKAKMDAKTPEQMFKWQSDNANKFWKKASPERKAARNAKIVATKKFKKYLRIRLILALKKRVQDLTPGL